MHRCTRYEGPFTALHVYWHLVCRSKRSSSCMVERIHLACTRKYGRNTGALPETAIWKPPANPQLCSPWNIFMYRPSSLTERVAVQTQGSWRRSGPLRSICTVAGAIEASRPLVTLGPTPENPQWPCWGALAEPHTMRMSQTGGQEGDMGACCSW